MMREWMDSQIKANERMKNQVVELECQINQGVRNHQVVIHFLERKLKFLNGKLEVQRTISLPHTTIPKSRQEDVEGIFKPPAIRNEHENDDVEIVEEDEIELIPTMPNSS
uniref:Uncharacterized protein n=1 Tax=Tanacetum cinerariifolium TaxID=118510 RepID=A0A699JEH0_TANCI|nr:hypothetical protein [Tanacetum cinerariifolium]